METSITGSWTTKKFQADFITGYTYTNPVSTTPDTTTTPNPDGLETTYSSTSQDTTGMLLKVPISPRFPV